MAKKGKGSTINVPGQILYIGKEVAQDYFRDYTDNITNLINDAKEIGDQLTQGKSKVVDIVADIKQNGGKKLTDWFMQRADESGEYDLLDDGNNSDFDAGFQVGDSGDEEQSSGSSIVDEGTMKDIARGQVNAMYQIGAKQAEASMINAAEIVSHIDGRASEIVTSLNNMNKSIIGIGEKIDALGKLLQTQTEIEEEQARSQSMIGSDGRVTLKSWFESMKKGVLDNTINNPLVQILAQSKDMLTPAAVIGMMLDGTKQKQLGGLGGLLGSGLDKLGIGGGNMKDTLKTQTVDSLGTELNRTVGNMISDFFMGTNKKMDDVLGKIPVFGDMIKSALNGSRNVTRERSGEDYRSQIKNDYTKDKATFDGIVRKTIVEVIPDYLKLITKALTGKDYHVSTNGHVTDKEEDMSKMLDVSMFQGNMLNNNANSRRMQHLKDNKANLNGLTGNNKNATDSQRQKIIEKLNKHDGELMTAFTEYTLWYCDVAKIDIFTKDHLNTDAFWSWVSQEMIANKQDVGTGLTSYIITYWVDSLKYSLTTGSGVTGYTNDANDFIAEVNKRLKQVVDADKELFANLNAVGQGDKFVPRTRANTHANVKGQKEYREKQKEYDDAMNKKLQELRDSDEYKEKSKAKINNGALNKLGVNFDPAEEWAQQEMKKWAEENKKLKQEADEALAKFKNETKRDQNLGSTISSEGIKISGIQDNFQKELFEKLDVLIASATGDTSKIRSHYKDQQRKENEAFLEEWKNTDDYKEMMKMKESGEFEGTQFLAQFDDLMKTFEEDLLNTGMEKIDKTSYEKKVQVSGISESFQNDLFTRIDQLNTTTANILSAVGVLKTSGNGDIPSILNNIYGRGDDEKKEEETPKEDEIIADTASKMAQTNANDGDLASDLPFLKRMTSQMKNKGLGNKLSQMFTMWGNDMKKGVKDKVNGALNKSPIGSAISKYILPAIAVVGGWIKKKLSGAFKLIGNKLIKPALGLVKKGMEWGMKDVREGWTQIWGTQEEREKRKEEREKRREEKRVVREQKRARKQALAQEKALREGAEKGTHDGAKEGAEKGIKEGEGAGGGDGGKKPGFFKRVTGKIFGNKNKDTGTGGGTTTDDPTVGAAQSESSGEAGGGSSGGSKKGGFLGKIANTLGGMGKMLAGVGKMILTAIASLTAVKVIMDLVQKTLNTAVKPLNKAFQKLTGTIKKLLKAVGDSIKYVANLVVKLIDSLMPILNVVVDLVGELLGGILGALDPILNVLTGLIDVLVGPINMILDLVMDVVGPVLTSVGTIVESIGELLTGVLTPILQAVGSLVDALMPILNPLLELTNMAINWLVTDGPLGWALDKITWTLTKVANIIGIIAGGIQGAVGIVQAVLGKILEGVGTIISLMPFSHSAGKKIKKAGEDMFNASEETLESAQEQIDSSVGALTGKNKETKSDAASSGLKTDQSNAIATPIPSTGGTMDSIRGSGDTYSEDQRYNPIETFGPFLEAIWTELNKSRTIQEETVEPVMEDEVVYRDLMLGNITKHINKQMMMASKVFIPMYATMKADIVPVLESIEALTKLSIGNDQSFYGQQLAAEALQLVAAGSTAAGAALFQTSIGLSASGMAYQAEGSTAKANQFSYLTTGNPFYISSLYPDAVTDDTSGSEITDPDEEDQNISDDPNVENPDSGDTGGTSTPSEEPTSETPTTIIPDVPKPSSGYRDYYGNGDSQGSYGSYLNMGQRGCGPVALADAANRRGGSVNAGALASSMASSGNYSSSRGTSVGGFINTAASMGMGYQVGGVTSQSLNRATPNNPVTLVGSGAGFGTRSGNTHYINVVGTDHAGGAYVSNPLSGRVERRSANELASSSVVGLYGSGDVRGIPSALYGLYGNGPATTSFTFTTDDPDKCKTTAAKKRCAKYYYNGAGSPFSSDDRTVIGTLWSQSNPVSFSGNMYAWLKGEWDALKIKVNNPNNLSPTEQNSIGTALKNWLTQKRASFVLNTLGRNQYGQVEDPVEPATTADGKAARQKWWSNMTADQRAEWVLESIQKQSSALYNAVNDNYQHELAEYMKANPHSIPPYKTLKEWVASKVKNININTVNWKNMFKTMAGDYLEKYGLTSVTTDMASDSTTDDTLSSDYTGSSIAGTTGAAPVSISAPPGGTTGYISTEQKYSADAGGVVPTVEGDTFKERMKSAMSGLTGIFSKILGLFSMNDSDEVDEAVEESEDVRKERAIREAVGNEEYERYETMAYEAFVKNNPKYETETDEHYKARLESGWSDPKTKRKYLLAVSKNNANMINAMKVNGMVDASEGSMSSIYGEYDPETGTWSGGMLNAALGQGGSIVESSYNDPYAGKFVSDGGAVMWTDTYQPTIFDTDITEDGGSTLSKSPVHEFFWQTSGVNNGEPTEYAFSRNGNWYTKRNNPDKTGTGDSGDSHQGVDVLTYPKSMMESGKSELHAITGGKVIDVRYHNEGNPNSPYNQSGDGGWGNSVQFEDAAGYFHRYAHMRDKPTVNVGDTITPGQLLGVIGTTGMSTGEHVHYQINPPGHGNEDGNYVNPMTYFKYHQPSTAAGAVQGEIPFEGVLQGGNVWDTYEKRYHDDWPAFIQKGATAGMTPAEIATIISTGIWEDGAKKFFGAKSLTGTTYDSGGQRAEGIMNWVEKGVAAGTVEEQLKYIKDRYWQMTPMDGRTESGTYRKTIANKGGEAVFKETTGRSGFTLNVGDRYANKLNSDLIEGSTYFYQGDLQPSKVYTTKGLAENVGTAVGVYNWLLRNGYAVAPSSYETNAQNNSAENASQIGTGTGGPDAYSTYSNQDTNMGIIWNYLRNNLGYSEAASAGVMGNLSAESGYYPMAVYVQGGSDHSQPDSFNRDVVDKFDSTHSWPLGTNDPYGIAQWLGGRRTSMLSKATSDGKSIADLPMQLEFMRSELEGSEKKAHSAMQNVGSVQAASDAWMNNFERCNGQAQEKRRKRAQEAYDRFKGTNGGVVDVNGGAFGANTGTTGSTLWIDTLNAVIHETDLEGLHDYAQVSHPITLNGKKISGRPDCTGMFQYALDYLDYDVGNINSAGLRNRCEQGMVHPITKDGEESSDFTAYKWSEIGKENVIPGDILVRKGHGEVGYGVVDGRLKGWNYGNTDDILRTQKLAARMLNGEPMDTVMTGDNVPGFTPEYTYVVRPSGQLAVASGGTTGTGGSNLALDGYMVGKHPTAANWAAKTYGYTGLARNSGTGKGFSSYAFGSIGGIANFVDASQYAGLSGSSLATPTATTTGTGLAGISTDLPSGPGIRATGVTETAPARESVVPGMSNSGLATQMDVPSNQQNRWRARDGKPTKVTWHTWSGYIGKTPQWLTDCWKSPRECSVNYGIGNDGMIMQEIDEGRGPWTTSSATNDKQAVTFEIENAPGAKGEEWEISDAAMQSAINLTVDIAKRNGIPGFYTTFKGDGYDGDGADGNFTYHRTFASKSCPGDYIFDRTNDILNVVNKAIAGSGDETPIPPINQSQIMQSVGTSDLSNLMIDTNEIPQASTTNVIVTKSSKAEDEMMERMMNHTYNVRAEQVELLLQQILDKMDNLSTKQPTTTTPKQTPNAFPNNDIPKQIQRLAKGI